MSCLEYKRSSVSHWCCVSEEMRAQKQMKIVGSLLLSTLCLVWGKSSEYQLETEVLSKCEQLRSVGVTQKLGHVPQCSPDGRFRHVQCGHGGHECWCVDGEGLEIPGRRQNGSIVYCLTSCQLQRQKALRFPHDTLTPSCSDSGEFQQVQCDSTQNQCWCVDQEGMEVYGTRQNGQVSVCPGVCEVRQRRLLHGIGEPSPPQCSSHGGFLPVQCKFVNTTDRVVFDLLHNFNRDPVVFQTFSGFRNAFPGVSSYCFCADSRGREMPSTGLELLLDEVYDTAFSNQTGNTFSQSNMYRILQRRYLAIQLALSGRFRCPTQCESERATAVQHGSFFVPACTQQGAYVSTQCVSSGQCWCVDPDGKEVFGTRQNGVPECSTEVQDCLSKRRHALSRLFHGPAEDKSKMPKVSLPLQNSCSPEFQELSSNLLQFFPDSPNVGDILAEFFHGMFPSATLALKALSFTSNPKRFQENLFGGKFLKNAGHFNFTAAVGDKGTLSFSQIFSQIGIKQASTNFMHSVKIFTEDSVSLNKDITDSYGRSVNLKNNQDLIILLSMSLENQQFLNSLQDAFKLLKAEDSTQLGQLFHPTFQNTDVCQPVSSLYVPQCDPNGRFLEIQCYGSECWCVDLNGLEISGSRSVGSKPRCPSQCEKERQRSILLKARSSAGSEIFIPKCEADGAYVAKQCLGKTCFCMDRYGTKLNNQSSGNFLQCPTNCQTVASQKFMSMVSSILSDSTSITQISDIYVPRCTNDGSWHQIQCDGPPEQAIDFYREWNKINNEKNNLSVLEFFALLRKYSENTEAMASFQGFLSELFKAGHHKVFPVLARYEKDSDIPSDILGGNVEGASGPSVFLNPVSFWRLMRREDSVYPGLLSDFSRPLGSFPLRQCWCVNSQGEMHNGSKVSFGQIPKCPGSCTLVRNQVSQFLDQAEVLISTSNSSHVPVGYGFLLAEGIYLSLEELEQESSSKFDFETLLKSSDTGLRLAAHSTLHFYWLSQIMSSEKNRMSLDLGYQPYSPQCDSYGQWLPRQCHLSTGRCWCVDEDGSYISDSLSRSIIPPKCQTTCQRLQSHFLLSDWKVTSNNVTSMYGPSCEENGEFSVFQKPSEGSSVGICVSPITGQFLQPATAESQCPGWCSLQKALALQRELGVGFEPQCANSGEGFSPLQCDQSSCWCASQSGVELHATRVSRRMGGTPVCNASECLLPYDSVSHGAVLCSTESVSGQKTQRCELFCEQGYVNTLPVGTFLCDPETKKWLGDAPLSHACQKPQVLQTVQVAVQLQLSLAEAQQGCREHSLELGAALLRDLTLVGLCHLKLNSLGQNISTGLCDQSSVFLQCLDDTQVTVHITFKALLSELPVTSLPDLHDIDTSLNEQKLLDGVKKLIQSESYKSLFSADGFQAFSSPPTFSCIAGYKQLPQSKGCVVCPAGSFSSSGVCAPCPRDTYQAEEGKLFCSPCPSGTSTLDQGAFSSSHCLTECQQGPLKCTEKGNFLSVQKHATSQRWFCVSAQGEEMSWTSSNASLTNEECKVLQKFEAVGKSSILVKPENVDLLRSDSSAISPEAQIRKCLLDCAHEDSCQHVAVFSNEGQSHCELYSTSVDNSECRTSNQTKGFLGNDGAETFQTLTCVLKIKGDEPNLIVLRKKGYEFNRAGQKNFDRLGFRKTDSGVYRTLVFEASGATLADVHHFCADSCSRDACCDGFILNQNVFNGGSIICGLLNSPSILMCNEDDWDVTGRASSNRTCGAGVQYSKQLKRFSLSFGGQNFIIGDAALPASSKNKTGYQETLINIQRLYLWNESDMNVRQKTSCNGSTFSEDSGLFKSDSFSERFAVLEEGDVQVDAAKELPRQIYWLFKHQHSLQRAQQWCLRRCEEEELCHVSDVRDEGPLYFTCVLYPDTRVCGAYDKPLRQECSLVVAQMPQAAHKKKLSLSGSVKSFYSRLPFKKMVSYSVRSRVSLFRRSITEGFFECERRCDEDPCCRGVGYVKDSEAHGMGMLCLTLNSLGVQTCAEDDATSWRIQDCSPSTVETQIYPFGWYEKPVNQWTKYPSVCPDFKLRSPSKNVDLKIWTPLNAASVLVDPSLSVFDAVHISRDIAEDQDKVRDWCLSVCEEHESCSAVSLDSRDSAVRCVMYPDTHACFPTSSGQRCVLVTKEAAQQLYVRTDFKANSLSISIPGHGILLGGSEVKTLSGFERRRVNYFLGVSYARPPVGDFRFSSPLPEDWTGVWNATFPRPSCLQPGDGPDSTSSEDCLYLNVFVPGSARKKAAVLVFFHNSGSGLLDGSNLAAVGNVIVVTASFRAAAFGFLSTGSSALPGNYGLQDQEAALAWVQKNIRLFGGDPNKVTMGAERSGADVASLHLISPSASSLFRRALLMGGSVFSPAVVNSHSKARAQSESLARELGCSSSDDEQLLSCLRSETSQNINAAQTKLLAVSGPLQAWSPVVDGHTINEEPSVALQSGHFLQVELLLGSSVEDGLISRAKNIKSFEQLHGRADSKTAFYQALSNSLGGDDANVVVKEAASWFYSLQHAPTPSGYNVFSRALENATRDLFIICPAVDMAEFWSTNSQSGIYMYHLPEDSAFSSVDLSAPLDLQFFFGVPLASERQNLFTSEEKRLSLQIMNYLANFIKSGNPNLPLAGSRTSFSRFLPPWPKFMAQQDGRSFKKLSYQLNDGINLQSAQCSFWSQFVPALKMSTGDAGALQKSTQKPFSIFSFSSTTTKQKSDKDAYN